MTQNKARRTNKIDFLQLPWAQEVPSSNLGAPTRMALHCDTLRVFRIFDPTLFWLPGKDPESLRTPRCQPVAADSVSDRQLLLRFA